MFSRWFDALLFAVVLQLATFSLSFASDKKQPDDLYICTQLLTKVEPGSMKKPEMQEEAYYPKNEQEKLKSALRVCENGCLVYVADGTPFDTTRGTHTTFRGDVSPNDHAILVVDTSGVLLGNIHPYIGRTHHSTPLSGGDALFAGSVKTNAAGKIIALSYHSGHYKLRPYNLKILIDDLGGPTALADVEVELSDIKVGSPLLDPPKLTVAQFYNFTEFSFDTGYDVLFNYILQVEPDLSLGVDEVILPVLAHMFFSLVRPEKLEKFLLRRHEQPNLEQIFIRKMVDWAKVIHTPETRTELYHRIKRGEVYAHYLITQHQLRFKREFYRLLFAEIPSLKTALAEREIVIDQLD